MKNAPSRASRARTVAHAAPSAHVGEAPLDKGAAVLGAARGVFMAHGFSAATTDMIQQAAGVSKATVYAHYRTKEALFIAVVDAECERFIASIRALQLNAAQPDELLLALARAYLEIVLSPAGLDLFRVVIADAPRFPELARKFYLAGPHTLSEIVAAHLDTAAEQGQLDFSAVGRDVAASLFVNLVRGELQLQSLTHPGSVPSAAQRDLWARAAVRTFVRAYGKREGAGRRRP